MGCSTTGWWVVRSTGHYVQLESIVLLYLILYHGMLWHPLDCLFDVHLIETFCPSSFLLPIHIVMLFFINGNLWLYYEEDIYKTTILKGKGVVGSFERFGWRCDLNCGLFLGPKKGLVSSLIFYHFGNVLLFFAGIFLCLHVCIEGGIGFILGGKCWSSSVVFPAMLVSSIINELRLILLICYYNFIRRGKEVILGSNLFVNCFTSLLIIKMRINNLLLCWYSTTTLTFKQIMFNKCFCHGIPLDYENSDSENFENINIFLKILHI